MNLFSAALKLNNLFTSNTVLQSFIAAENQGVTGTGSPPSIASGVFTLIGDWIARIFSQLLYFIATFILNLIEVVQIGVCRLLGIAVDLNDFVVIDMSNPIVKILTSETVLTVFKYVCGISLVLLIIFTCFTLIKSEVQFAIEKRESNDKGRILLRTLRSLFIMLIFPAMLILGIVSTNAILAGFNSIMMGGDSNTNLASQIFIATSYEANNYRNYADSNVRVPILINFEDPYANGMAAGYSKEELATIYKSFQETGRKIYDNYADGAYPSFGKSISYKNNKIYNNSSYSGFERFVCTREQYYVMADFIDYAVKHNLKYYVKNMTDNDIAWQQQDENNPTGWKDIQGTIYDKENQTLKITYKNYSDVTDGESYTITYTPNQDQISTPISDAIRTISALLAFGGYSENTFNMLHRLEDSINIVEWQTDKVLIRLSDHLKDVINKGGFENEADAKQKILDAMDNRDKLILYERARFEYNNTISATISDLFDGIELPVMKISRRYFQSTSGKYITEGEDYVCFINGTYYRVYKDEGEYQDSKGNFIRDSEGDAYYLLETNFTPIEFKNGDNESKGSPVDIGTVFTTLSGGTGISIENLGAFIKTDDNFKEIIETVRDYTVEETDPSGNPISVRYEDEVSKVIKQTAWPNKLINDIQTIYKDININNLIANGKWLEALGDYYNGNGSGDYSASFQTGLIHPIGLILSEMFLGEISVSDKILSMGSLEYNSKFDERTINAMLLSMLGEERYFQAKAELEYFIEIFNGFMAPVLDEISYYENFDLMSGNAASVQLYTYKAFLASVLMSDNAAAWFYNTAMAMLGATDIKDHIVNSETGYYKKFEELEPFYQNYVVEAYRSAYNRLKSQFVFEGDKAYPEYMTALKNYIGKNLKNYLTDDEKRDYESNSGHPIWTKEDDKKEFFFDNDRLDNVLRALLSIDKRAEILDRIKYGYIANGGKIDNDKSLVTLYQNAITWLNSAITTCRTTEESINNSTSLTIDEKYKAIAALQTIEGRFIGLKDELIKPTSNFSFELNDFFKQEQVAGETAKDDFDTLMVSFNIATMIEECKEKISSYSSLVGIVNNALASAGLSKISFSDSAVVSYLNRVIDYCNAKNDFVTEDGSSALVGQMDDLKTQLRGYYDQLTASFNALKQNTGGLEYTTFGISLAGLETVFGIDNSLSKFLQFYSGERWDDMTGKTFGEMSIPYVDLATGTVQTVKLGGYRSLKYQYDVLNKNLQTYLNNIENSTAFSGTADEIREAKDLKKTYVQSFINALGDFIRTQETIDKLNRYELVFAIESEKADESNSSLDIVINSKHYTVGQNFTRVKFIEYVLGSKAIKELKGKEYNTIFVDDNYEGLVRYAELTNSELNEIKQQAISRAKQDYDTSQVAIINQYLDYGTISNENLISAFKAKVEVYNSQLLSKYVSKTVYDKDNKRAETKYYKLTPSFNELHDFAVEIGNVSATLYQMTNLANLSTSSRDDIAIGAEIVRKNETSDELIIKDNQKDLAERVLNMLLTNQYLPDDLVASFFNVELKEETITENGITRIETAYTRAIKKLLNEVSEDEKLSNVELAQQNNRYLNTVLSYLLTTEGREGKDGYVDYSKLTLKELRTACLQALIDFEQQEGETTEQNQKRYLALLALGCSDWVSQETSTDINGVTITGPELGAVNCNWPVAKRNTIVSLKPSAQSQAVILRLAGLENRPYEELIGAEYTIDFNFGGPDEKNGDIFIICTFDEETRLYRPFLMSNKASYDAYTEYYMADDKNEAEVWFPVVAKGIVTIDGRPTAIRENEGNIEYYHDQVVIRNVSDIGLTQYFLSTDQIKVRHTALSRITNGISKLFTGKSIIENLAAKIPRFAAHSNINLCYGVDSQLTASMPNGYVAMSYNFGRAGNYSMDKVYDVTKINMVMLLLATFATIFALFKILFAATQRVFDIALDFLLAPLAISTIALKTDDPHEDKDKRKAGETQETSKGAGYQTYDQWKQKTQNDIISVLGYTVGINMLFILVPLISRMTLFENTSAFASLPLFRDLSVSFLNEIARLIFLVAATYICKNAPKAFNKIMKVDGSGGVYERAENVQKAIKSSVNEVRNTWSGTNAVQDVKNMAGMAKAMVPGTAVVKGAVKFTTKAAGSVASRAAYRSLRKKGLSKQQAKEYAQNLKDSVGNLSDAI